MIGHCDLCHTKNEGAGYGDDFTCEECGQEHVYVEGHSIVLSDEQRALLINYAKTMRNRKCRAATRAMKRRNLTWCSFRKYAKGLAPWEKDSKLYTVCR